MPPANAHHTRRRPSAIGLAAAMSLVAGVVIGWLAHQASTTPAIGPTATVRETTTGARWLARVDTGATISSLHCPIDRLDGVIAPPNENVGRTVTLRVTDDTGAEHRIEAPVVGYGVVRTEGGVESRYKVRLTLECAGVRRSSIVSLNNRSHMRHQFLLGRDFLVGAFQVDVARGSSP